MTKTKRIFMVFCAALMCIQIYSLQANTTGETEQDNTTAGNTSYIEAENYLYNMSLVAENSELLLYFDPIETGIAVKVKKTGDIWFSNPPEANNDPLASNFYKNRMKSQFSIQYYNDNVQLSEMDNYSESIQEGQFEVTHIENGITITYTLGELAASILLPAVISEERMLLYTSMMDDATARKVIRNFTLIDLEKARDSEKAGLTERYPGITDYNIYVLKDGTKDYIKEELGDCFAAVGYTVEDKEQDEQEDTLADESEKPWFTIPLTYTIEGGNLLASIDPAAIEYNTDGIYLTTIQMLSFFGAAGTNEDGYIFVPDGSGALINLNNGKTSVPAYNAFVYGEDNTLTFMNPSKSEVNENLTIKMPVFGIKKGNQAMLAIIEEGDGYASITARVSGMVCSYNNVNASFQYLQSGAIALSQIVGGSNSFQMYSKPVFIGSYKLRYSFLHGDEADYSGMAAVYRSYLVDRGLLHKNATGGNTALFIELIGAIEKYKSFLGIKYMALEPLTTYSQATEISAKLQEQGVDNLIIKYSGWANGGLNGGAITAIKPSSALQKGMTFKEYIERMNGQGVAVYMDADFQYVYKDGLFDGFNESSDSPKYFDNTIARSTQYNISTGEALSKSKLFSPNLIASVTGKFLKRTSKLQLPGVSIGKLSYNLYSDLSESKYVDRQDAILRYSEAMDLLSQAHPVLADNANAYTLSHAESVVNIPLYTNGYLIFDEEVPFYAMVLRGYMHIAGEPLNNTDDYRTTLLKSVETGADIFYQWIYEDNSKLVGTAFDYLYAVNYKNWIDDAVSVYKRISGLYGGLQGKSIQKHEKLAQGVYQTTYEGGVKIMVNYNRTPVTQGNVTVGAMDFTLVKSGD